jgi:hypothetical protein
LLSIRGARPGQPVEHLVNRVSIVQCEAVERVAYFAVLYPGEESPRWAFCVPRLDDDPKVEAVWRRLAQRGGITVAAGPLQGWLDTAEAGLVRAWARDAANSNMPVPVEVVVDGVVLGSTLANHYRADLATAGYGHGRNGIEFRFPVPLASDRLHCSLPGAQPIAHRSPARRDCCRAPQPESAVQLKVGSSRKKE